jgi:hypothetical protein
MLSKFWEENKKAIKVAVVGAIAIIGVGYVYIKKDLDNAVNDCIAKQEFDFGRDCLITYSDEETGEILWKDRCTEYYVNQMKDIGIQFDEIKKLNEIED